MMLSQGWAVREAGRCLQCHDAPCTLACPAHINIPGFIAALLSGNPRGAAEEVRSANAFANVCGRVCPQEVFCQSVCLRARHDRPVAIRELHLYATRWEAAHGFSIPRFLPPRGKRVAVIGGGPAGCACAFGLVQQGVSVNLFDRGTPGGVPRNSIPAFRLEDNVILSDTEFLSQFFDTTAREITPEGFEELRRRYDAVFVGVGLGRDRRLGIPGEDLHGVLPVLGFLEQARSGGTPVRPGSRVVVVGGGNVSLDAAATAKRLGADDVVVIYRRGEQEMRVWKAELEEARRMGVAIRFLTAPVALLGKSELVGIRCCQTSLTGQADATGRRLPVVVPGTEFELAAEHVLVAIGQEPDAEFLNHLHRSSRGYVDVDSELRTSLPGVFAGGDVVGGEGTIVQAVAQGAEAARRIAASL